MRGASGGPDRDGRRSAGRVTHTPGRFQCDPGGQQRPSPPLSNLLSRQVLNVFTRGKEKYFPPPKETNALERIFASFGTNQ